MLIRLYGYEYESPVNEQYYTIIIRWLCDKAEKSSNNFLCWYDNQTHLVQCSLMLKINTQ